MCVFIAGGIYNTRVYRALKNTRRNKVAAYSRAGFSAEAFDPSRLGVCLYIYFSLPLRVYTQASVRIHSLSLSRFFYVALSPSHCVRVLVYKAQSARAAIRAITRVIKKCVKVN